MKNENYYKFKEARDKIFSIMNNPGEGFDFTWPNFQNFNWVKDWFDSLIDRPNDALVIINEKSTERYTYAELISSSSQVANWMVKNQLKKGDMIFLHLDNRIELFQLMLAAIRVGAIIIPCSTNLPIKEIETRLDECGAKFIFFTKSQVNKFKELPNSIKQVIVDSEYENYLSMSDVGKELEVFECAPTLSTDPLFAYFTSGSTSRPKLVIHSHQSYPVGHLSSLLWNGTRINDMHFNLSPPGWAKHSWSSLFVPWNAEATNVVTNIKNITPKQVLDILHAEKINTFCAPPTFWRSLVSSVPEMPKQNCLREIVSAGEPLEPSLILEIEKSWGKTLRNGYGQTEATAIIGQCPGTEAIPGSIGTVLPGYKVVVLDIKTGLPSKRGELCIDIKNKPVGIMNGYKNTSLNKTAFSKGLYYTNDICHVDDDGNYFLEGRKDNVFKSFDFRVSPYELEYILQEIDAITEVAVVPSPNKLGGAVPQAYVVPKHKIDSGSKLAQEIFDHTNQFFPPDFLLDSLIICDALPLTQTGKINREELRLFSLKPNSKIGSTYTNIERN